MIAGQCALIVERRRLHAKRIENFRLHRFVIGSAQFELRIQHMACGEAGAPASRLEYWNISPNLLVGCTVASVASAPSGVTRSY